KGLKYLELAYEKGLYSKYEALWWLTSFNMGEGNEEKASQYLTLILDKFPNNPIYLLQMGNFLLNQNNVDKALEYYNRSMAIDAGEMKKLAVYGNAGVARCFYLKNQFEKAIEKYELFLNSVSGKDDRFRNRDNAIYLLANAYEIIGEREKAVQYYSKVKYNDLSKLRLKQPLTQFQILAIKAYNTALSINFNEGVEQLKKFLSSKSLNADERAFSYYQLGLLYSSRKDYANSNLFFSKVLQEEVVVENYLKPYSTYYIGQNYLKLNDKSSAKKQFDKVKEFKDYYGEGSLKRLNNRALERL
ncbi:MAG: DUF3808 domain-containing protein, partial [Ignavibacteria bacterium]|nr:DUF3808 domain-containing protein [Ignavibacteria bacterium]